MAITVPLFYRSSGCRTCKIIVTVPAVCAMARDRGDFPMPGTPTYPCNRKVSKGWYHRESNLAKQLACSPFTLTVDQLLSIPAHATATVAGCVHMNTGYALPACSTPGISQPGDVDTFRQAVRASRQHLKRRKRQLRVAYNRSLLLCGQTGCLVSLPGGAETKVRLVDQDTSRAGYSVQQLQADIQLLPA